MVAVFPRALLRERSHSWNLAGVASMAGNATLPATVVRSDGGGFWQCSISDVSLSGIKGSDLRGKQRQKQATLLWRAVRQICDGGITSIVVPRNDALFRPYPTGVTWYGNITHSDDALFSDGSGYYQPVIDIEVATDADLRATTLVLAVNYAGDLMGGEAFAIEHPEAGWRMYEIATVELSGEIQPYAVVTFNPPLREAVEAGTYVEFDRPRCTMRLAKPGSMDLTVQPWNFNSASAEFVEAPW